MCICLFALKWVFNGFERFYSCHGGKTSVAFFPKRGYSCWVWHQISLQTSGHTFQTGLPGSYSFSQLYPEQRTSSSSCFNTWLFVVFLKLEVWNSNPITRQLCWYDDSANVQLECFCFFNSCIKHHGNYGVVEVRERLWMWQINYG